MEACSSTSVLSYRRSKPLGKVKQRVQDLRIPSSSYTDFIASRPPLDLSHNESARLAADCLLSRGLEAYHELLKTEGEVDFLSKLDKKYFLENGSDGHTGWKDDPSAPEDDDDKESESLSAGSQSSTQCPAVSTDSDPTETGLHQCSLKDVESSGPVLNETSIEIIFLSDRRAAGMKDLVRQFIRKAKLALAIVMDSFSDIELLCDLLEASRKRNVSVHLLLDHLNLNLFVSMWQELKLNSKNFPKLSVRSVAGQTYCAKTGRKLTGQIAESFIITDWAEVLTGSYSFSWLSWQVHRSLAVLMKGSSATPFHQEFQRLYSSSKPVSGFVTFITVPHTLCLSSASHAAQNSNTHVGKRKSNQNKTMCHSAWDENTENTATVTVLCSPQRPKVESGKDDEQPVHRAGTDSQTDRKAPQLHPKPLVQSGAECGVQTVSEKKPSLPVGAVCTQQNVRTNVEPLEKNQKQSQSHSNPHDQTQLSYVQSQPPGVNITSTAENKARVQESNPLRSVSLTPGQDRTARYQTILKNCSDRDHPDVGTEGFFFRQRSRNILTGLNTQRGRWNYARNFKPKVELPSDNPKPLSPPASQQTQAKTSLQFPFTSPRGQTTISFLQTRRQDQPQRRGQPPLQSHPNTESPGSKPAPAGMGARLRPQLHADSNLLLPGTRAKMHLQCHPARQMKSPPRLNWTPQNHHAARPGAVARHSSFSAAPETGHRMEGQLGWRPFQSSTNMTLGRSKSMTDRRTAGLHPNRTQT